MISKTIVYKSPGCQPLRNTNTSFKGMGFSKTSTSEDDLKKQVTDTKSLEKINEHKKEVEQQKPGLFKSALEMSLTAAATATAIYGLKNGFNYTGKQLGKLGRKLSKLANSQISCNLKEKIAQPFKYLRRLIKNRSETNKAYGFFNKTIDKAGNFFNKIARGLKTQKSKNIAKTAFITAPKWLLSICTGVYAGLASLENVIDPGLDRIIPDKKAENKNRKTS